MTVAALYVETNGTYFGLEGVDPWDIKRDARNYNGPWPVVAHPPCAAWSKMAPINAKRWGSPIGEDSGCFASALSSVRRFGGVLEHPAFSMAWKTFGLPRPKRGTWLYDSCGWTTEVYQSAYGHRAAKRTWLYAVCTEHPSPLDWSIAKPTGWISGCNQNSPSKLPTLSKKEALATPPAFRDVLISIARSAYALKAVA